MCVCVAMCVVMCVRAWSCACERGHVRASVAMCVVMCVCGHVRGHVRVWSCERQGVVGGEGYKERGLLVLVWVIPIEMGVIWRILSEGTNATTPKFKAPTKVSKKVIFMCVISRSYALQLVLCNAHDSFELANFNPLYTLIQIYQTISSNSFCFCRQ